MIAEKCANIVSQENEKRLYCFLRPIYLVWLITLISKANIFCLLELHSSGGQDSDPRHNDVTKEKLIKKLEKAVERLNKYFKMHGGNGNIRLKHMNTALQILVFKVM